MDSLYLFMMENKWKQDSIREDTYMIHRTFTEICWWHVGKSENQEKHGFHQWQVGLNNRKNLDCTRKLESIPSGKRLQFAIENGHRNSYVPWKMVILHSCLYVLPEGKLLCITLPANAIVQVGHMCCFFAGQVEYLIEPRQPSQVCRKDGPRQVALEPMANLGVHCGYLRSPQWNGTFLK